MIQVNELRIGNCYEADSSHYLSELDDKVEILESIVKDSKWRGGYRLISKNTNSIAIQNASPIPLTEEILLGCGFIRIKTMTEETHYFKGDFGLIFDGENYRYEYVRYSDTTGNVEMVNVKQIPSNPLAYLHQLQNLYFALTGKELEVKL